MKFQIRDGFVVRLVNLVKIDDNKVETQEINYYGGQVCDLSAEDADLHTHKLEPKDKAAEAYLASKVAPPSTPVGPPVMDVAAIIAAAVQAGMAAALAASGAPAAVASAPGKSG